MRTACELANRTHPTPGENARIAGQAVEKSTTRRDVERRGLLVVEGAQALERPAAGVAQLQVLAHDLVDGRTLAYGGDVLVADPASQLRLRSARPLPRFRRGESSPSHRH